jgi:hypothetical protein
MRQCHYGFNALLDVLVNLHFCEVFPFGEAAFFGVGIDQLERARLGSHAKNQPCFIDKLNFGDRTSFLGHLWDFYRNPLPWSVVQ